MVRCFGFFRKGVESEENSSTPLDAMSPNGFCMLGPTCYDGLLIRDSVDAIVETAAGECLEVELIPDNLSSSWKYCLASLG